MNIPFLCRYCGVYVVIKTTRNSYCILSQAAKPRRP